MRGTPMNPAYTDDGLFGLPDTKQLGIVGQVQGGNPLAQYAIERHPASEQQHCRKHVSGMGNIEEPQGER